MADISKHKAGIGVYPRARRGRPITWIEAYSAEREYQILETFAKQTIGTVKDDGLTYYTVKKLSKMRDEFVLKKLKWFRLHGYLRIVSERRFKTHLMTTRYAITAKGLFSLLYATSVNMRTEWVLPEHVFPKTFPIEKKVLYPDHFAWSNLDNLAAKFSNQYWLFGEWEGLGRAGLQNIARYLLLSSLYHWREKRSRLPSKNEVMVALIAPLGFEFTAWGPSLNDNVTTLVGLDGAWLNIRRHLSKDEGTELSKQAESYLRSDKVARAYLDRYLRANVKEYERVTRKMEQLYDRLHSL